ncbi:hypothetical protein Tco_0269373 [Tanacetum coccineum]
MLTHPQYSKMLVHNHNPFLKLNILVLLVNQQPSCYVSQARTLGLAVLCFKQGVDPIDAIRKSLGDKVHLLLGKVTWQDTAQAKGKAKAVLMANLTSYRSDFLSKAPHSENTHNDMLIKECKENVYCLKTQNAAVSGYNSSAQQDAMILYVFEQLSNQVTNCNNVNKDNLIANESLSAELERYKEWVKLLEERQHRWLLSTRKSYNGEMQKSDKKQGKRDLECPIPINRGLIQAIPASLPPQPIGEATKASNLQRIPPGVQGRSHFTYFLYIIVQIRILLALGTTLDLPFYTTRRVLCTFPVSALSGTVAGVDIDTHTMEQYLALSRENQAPGVGPIPRMTPTQALTAIHTMADHSQKWHDRTTSREYWKAVVAIGGGERISCFGPSLDRIVPQRGSLNKVERGRYGEFGQTTPFNGNNGEKFHVGPPGYYTKTNNRPPYGERR